MPLGRLPEPYCYTGHLIRRAQQRHNTLWRQEVSKRVSSVQYAALTTLQRSPGLSQIELGEPLDLDRSTIADLVSRMVARGVVSREQDPGDRRRKLVHLTPMGVAEVNRLRPGVERVNRLLTASLADQETRQLKRILRLLLGAAGEG